MKMKLALIPVLIAILLFILLPAGSDLRSGEGDDDGLGDREDMESKNAKAINAAVKKGADWLKKRQKPDGSWLSDGATEKHYPIGTTAFAMFALLKAGIDRKDACFARGWNYIRTNLKFTNNTGVYDLSTVILALEAYYTQPTKKQKKSEKKYATSAEERSRKNFRKRAGGDLKWMKEMIDWLVLKQNNLGAWRYPGIAQDGSRVDASNTQYVMLALNAGRRLGFPIPSRCWIGVLVYFNKEQDKDGPKVEPFHVPAADFPIKKLKKIGKKFYKEMRKYLKKPPKDRAGHPRTSVDPYEDYGTELMKMKARGWSYTPRGHKLPSNYADFATTCGSMTTSGVAALIIAKAGLERSGGYKKYKKKNDQAIRDGCAWLARNFTLTGNPGRGGYHYYYLYGLERAGVLSLCTSFGDHNWYDEGSEYLLKQQNATGAWPEESHKKCSTDIATCFALLFLCKATSPIVNVPETITTGGDLGRKKEKEK